MYSLLAPSLLRLLLAWAGLWAATLALCPGLLNAATPTLETGVVRNASALVPQPDGKIVAVGEWSDNEPMSMVRLNPDGTMDNTFVPAGFTLSWLDSLTLLPSGKLLLAGSLATAAGGTPTTQLLRLNADGSIDPNFQPGNAYAPTPLVQADGCILLLGDSTTPDGLDLPTLSRLHADGSLDASYQPAIVFLADGSYDLSLQADGKLLVIGEDGASTGQPSLQRLNPDGSLDVGFRPADAVARGYGVATLALAPDGKLLVAEYADDDGDTCTLSRLNPDGSTDPAFTAPAALDGSIDQLAGDTAGRVVFSGEFTTVNGSPRAGFARLNADGSLDVTFNPLAGVTADFDGFVATAAGTVTFARELTAAENNDPSGAPGTLVERLGADGSSASVEKITSCAWCDLVPSADGTQVYVEAASLPVVPVGTVISDQIGTSADPVAVLLTSPIAPPPSPGGPVVNDLPLVTLKTVRSKVYSGGSLKGKLMLTRTGDVSADLTVTYLIKGSAVPGRDYQNLRGYRTIMAGKAKARIRIKPLHHYFHRVSGGRAAVKLVLQPGSSYEIGAPANARVRIINRRPSS